MREQARKEIRFKHGILQGISGEEQVQKQSWRLCVDNAGASLYVRQVICLIRQASYH
jgi:hypothetical protein